MGRAMPQGKASAQGQLGMVRGLRRRCCWSADMVDHDSRKFRLRWITPAICLFLLLTGCGPVIQPSRKTLAGANSLGGNVQLNIQIDLISTRQTVFYYESTVLASGNAAEWSGKATAFYAGTYFTQDCDSVCDSSGSAKLWRGRWVRSGNVSPLPMVQSWLDQAAAGDGSYLTRPVIPAEQDKELEGLTEPAYRIVLHHVPLQWSALCDAVPDTLFGGAEMFAEYAEADVTLFFGCADLKLDTIYLTVDNAEHWLRIIITPAPFEKQPQAMPTELGDGQLSEEWSIVRSGK